MKNSKPRVNLRALVESALLVAIAFVLSNIILFRMPQGGSVTAISMLPLLMIGLRHGLKWGISAGIVYACLQMLQQFWPPPSGTIAAYISVVMLDYILAFAMLGLSGLFRNKHNGILYAAPFCVFLRFLCHFISGAVVWSAYWRDPAAWLFSLIYNGTYIGVELVITTIIAAILYHVAPILFKTQTKPA